MRAWMWSVACAVVCAAVGGCANAIPPQPPLVAKAELEGIRVLVPAEAEITVMDSLCDASGIPKQWAHSLAVALAEAGFETVTTPEREHDTEAKLSVALNACPLLAGTTEGEVVLTLEPGRTFQTEIHHLDEPWQRYLVRQAQEAPQILALAKPRAAEPPAAPTEGGTAPSSVEASAAADHWIAGTPQRNAYALVVGIEQYREAPRADGARRDAQRFAALARTTLGVPEAQIKVALDGDATSSDVEAWLDWLGTNVPAGGRIYFYFSGHGAPDPSAGTPYLLPYNGKPSYLGKTALRLQDVLDALGKTKAADVVAIVDACFSGSGGRSVLPAGARPLVRMRAETPPARIVLLSAATGAQISGPNAAGDGGLFTSVLAEAIGHGKADMDGDGQLSLREIADWVGPRVERAARQASREQVPSMQLGRGLEPGALFVAAGLPSQ